MKYLTCLLVLLTAVACSDFECSNIKDAVRVRCINGEYERSSKYWNCFNEDTVDCDDTAICINNIVGCDLAAIDACLTNYITCTPNECAGPAVLNCPDSPYYHPDPDDAEGPATYVLSEAFAGCLTYTVTSEAGGYHARACREGLCIPVEEIESTVCGL
jgi:hypothetical protein